MRDLSAKRSIKLKLSSGHFLSGDASQASALGPGKEYEGFDHDDRAMRSTFQQQCGLLEFFELHSALKGIK
jgi:hypothetical protein